MATGVLLTGIIALLSFKLSVETGSNGAITGFTPMGEALFFSGLKWVVMLAPLGVVFYMSSWELLPGLFVGYFFCHLWLLLSKVQMLALSQKIIL